MVNALDKNGKTALHLAMENMYFSRVETLLEFGAGMSFRQKIQGGCSFFFFFVIMCAWQECSNCVNALKIIIIINNPVNVGRFKCSRAPGLHGWPSLWVVPLWQRVLQMTLLHASR